MTCGLDKISTCADGFRKKQRNPTSGSWWMIQARPTRADGLLESHRREPVDGSSPACQRLPRRNNDFILPPMLPTYTNINWAYQLHYYLSFRTHRRRPHFAEAARATKLSEIIAEICGRHDYHCLESKARAVNFRCLLSLRPAQDLSTVIGKIKGNAARECGLQLQLVAPVWARGYLARSVGRVNLSTVKQYIEHQAEHHGYAERHLPPIYRYRAAAPVELSAAHASFDLNHHLVFSTRRRAAVFDSTLGRALGEYWLRVAAKYGFAIDRLTIVPDHVHLLIRTVPKLDIATCALALMNNGEFFIARNYPHTLAAENIDQLWQPSAYAGTCGEVSTALVKAWLSSPL
jgi:putative transposase